MGKTVSQLAGSLQMTKFNYLLSHGLLNHLSDVKVELISPKASIFTPAWRKFPSNYLKATTPVSLSKKVTFSVIKNYGKETGKKRRANDNIIHSLIKYVSRYGSSGWCVSIIVIKDFPIIRKHLNRGSGIFCSFFRARITPMPPCRLMLDFLSNLLN